ncbi:MAG TPA: LLM class flavin-dependent oxidoreductase [Solirubrobacter sp.]|nr:LLM class flavin-dependent oxidoreductase [Solirubrobacter sp.]
MRVGIQLPEVEREVRWPEYLAMARAAEEVGFDSIWVGDHLLYESPDRGPWEAFTLLGALAASTSRVRLGPLVACAGFHPPGVLAKMAATVDEISGGRFVLGLGAGWNRREFDAFGIPYDKRVSRFEEAFTIIRALLAGERVTFDGAFHSADDAVLLPKPARRVPLMIGSNGPRMLSIALPHVDEWNTWYEDYGNTPEGLAELIARIGIPDTVRRSACTLVQFDGRPVEREPKAPPVVPADLPAHIGALGEAGADEVIVVASPIDEASIRSLGDGLGDLLV